MTQDLTIITSPDVTLEQFAGKIPDTWKVERSSRVLHAISSGYPEQSVVVTDASLFDDGPPAIDLRDVPGFPTSMLQPKFFDIVYSGGEESRNLILGLVDVCSSWVDLKIGPILSGSELRGLTRANPQWNWKEAWPGR